MADEKLFVDNEVNIKKFVMERTAAGCKFRSTDFPFENYLLSLV